MSRHIVRVLCIVNTQHTPDTVNCIFSYPNRYYYLAHKVNIVQVILYCVSYILYVFQQINKMNVCG